MKITFKEFFEKSKTSKYSKQLIIDCFMSTMKMVGILNKIGKNTKDIDCGEIFLNNLSSFCQLIDITLTNKDEITVEYISEILNFYNLK